MGWNLVNGQLKPVLMTLPPIPEACREIVSCGCTKGCLSQRCKCTYRVLKHTSVVAMQVMIVGTYQNDHVFEIVTLYH